MLNLVLKIKSLPTIFFSDRFSLRWRFLAPMMSMGILCFASCLIAQDNADGPSASSSRPVFKKATQDNFRSRRAADNSRFENLTDDRKDELLSFVREHHPQLEQLLNRLEANQTKRPRSYRQAIISLDRDVARLEGIRSRNSIRHELALNEWKLKSRINVISARMAVNESSRQIDELKKLVGEMLDLRVKQLEFDQTQLKKRLGTIESRIDELAINRDAMIERQLKSVQKRTRELRRRSNIGLRRGDSQRKRDSSDSRDSKSNGKDD